MPERRTEVESVEWASLAVHGPPDDVPGAFRAIWSDDGDRRMLGYRTLSRLVGHGGSSSAASVAAVPFLIDVVADWYAPDRFAACQVLRRIAIGEEEIILNARPNFADLRREAQRKAGLTVAELQAEQDEWVAAAADPAERRAREVAAFFRDVEDERESERVNAEAYDAVRAGVPVYRTALSAGDLATPPYAAQLLAYFPEDATSIVPALLPLIAGEDPIVASAAAVAAGICARGTEDPVAAATITARWVRADSVSERWAMAIGLAQLLNHPGPDIRADVGAAAAAPAPVPHFPFMDGDIAAVATYTLDRLEDTHTLPSGPWSAAG
jgi:hypothetical protein